jgi:hypothetical protein
MARLRFEGHWALVTAPDAKLSGTLELDAESGESTLDLIGTLGPHGAAYAETPSLILGWAADNELITLFRTHRSHYSIGSSGIDKTQYRANSTIIGAHFDSEADLQFRALSVHLSDLDEWAAVTGFAIQTRHDGLDFSIEYKRPEAIEALSGPPLHISIVTGHEGPTRRWFVKDVELHQKTYFVVEPSETLDVQAALRTVLHLQHFVALAVGRPVHVLSLRARVDVSDPNQGSEDGWVQAYPRWARRTLPSDPLHPSDMLFTLGMILDRLPDLMANWFGKRDLLKPVTDLFFGTLYSESMYLELRFLSLAQALESYHRRTMDHPRLPKPEHKKRLKAVIDSLPADQQGWVKDGLQNSNEIRLFERLQDIYAKFPTALDRHVPDREGFLRSIVDTRNYRTHFSGRKKFVLEDVAGLVDVLQKMRIMLEASLLAELGFDEQQISDLLARLDSRRVPPLVI